MKYLSVLLMVLLLSCGDNHGGDDDIYIDTTPTPPTDTLGVDTVLTLRDELSDPNKRICYFGEWSKTDTLGTEVSAGLEPYNEGQNSFSEGYKDTSMLKAMYFIMNEWNRRAKQIEEIGKRKGVDNLVPVERSIVYYQLVKRTFKYKL